MMTRNPQDAKQTLNDALVKVNELIVSLHEALNRDPHDDEDVSAALQIFTKELMEAHDAAIHRLPISKRP